MSESTEHIFTGEMDLGQIVPEDVGSVQNSQHSFIKKALYGLETAIVFAEVTPLNETLRLAACSYVAYKTHGNPLASGLALGSANMVIESGAAVATADLLSTDRASRSVGWVNEKLKKVSGKEEISKDLHPLAEVAYAYFGGSSIAMVAKQVKDPERTTSQNRRHGIFTAGWLSAVMTIQGSGIVDAISNPNPRTLGTAVAETGVIVGGAFWVKKTQNRKH